MAFLSSQDLILEESIPEEACGTCEICRGILGAEHKANPPDLTEHYVTIGILSVPGFNERHPQTKCKVRMLLREGLKYCESRIDRSHTLNLKWRIQTQNGIVFQAEYNGKKHLAEFYYTDCKRFT